MPSNALLIYLGHRWTGAARADRAYISAAKCPPHGVVSNIVDLVVCICCLGAVCLVSFHLHVPIRKDETYPVWPLACGFIMTLSLYAHPELLLGNDVPALSAVHARLPILQDDPKPNINMTKFSLAAQAIESSDED
ncbi:hypothetical protein JB92DRAFT_2830104 [Gautieria morchelliformis]|nr:hypothetical protein JB92DRAFT_2830104 [Gautieria morchelliformis]